MSAPAAVASIIARVAEMSQAPPAIAQIRERFTSLLSSTDLTSTSSTASTSAISTNASAATSTATATPVATFSPQTPRIDRVNGRSGVAIVNDATNYSGATSSISSSLTSPAMTAALAALPTPTGTWVDRIPNARGKLLAPAIASAANKYGLDPALLASVYWTESSYTPDVVSRTGAIGLGQLMPETAEWLKVDPWDPMQNIDGSARLYKYLLDKQGGNLDLAIASYAAGIGAVARAGGVPDQFTANYIVTLKGRMDYLNGARTSPP